MPKVTLCQITYDVQSESEDLVFALERAETAVCIVVTPNAEIAAKAEHDAALAAAIAYADLVLPDGEGVVLAAKLARVPIPRRRTGVSFALGLLAAADAASLRVYLLGGTDDLLERATKRILTRYPHLLICGTHNGYFDVNDIENDVLIRDICEKQPHITLVCMGAPRQELWMHCNRARLPNGVYGGFGGVLALLAGETKRAPLLWQRARMEWVYRTLREPRRLVRLRSVPGFLWRARRSRKAKI